MQPDTATYDEVTFWRVIEASYSAAELKKICSALKPMDPPSVPGQTTSRDLLIGFATCWLCAMAAIVFATR